MGKYTFPCITLAIMFIALIVSVIDIKDTMTTWILECFAVIIALIILPLTMKRFRLTNLLYVIILIHALILVYGGHYSYSEVPLGFWMSKLFGWKRNNYDKIGHFWQGVCPTMIAREIVARRTPLKKGKYLAFLSWCVAMTVSALYEIGEMIASVSLHGAATAFLGLQGSVWDTQLDMLYCLIGATVALILFTHLHNKQIAEVEKEDEETVKEETEYEEGSPEAQV
ncbi:membrane protein [Neocallimastix lanati (nom. inval.)]|jgi:putative membrane protein|nr:membrane protein [Neocallimastix sp. JGI-2020a]